MKLEQGYGQEAIDRFYDDRPDLSALYSIFMDYAADAYDAMPEPRFGQHDNPDKVYEFDRFICLFGPDTSHKKHPLWQHWLLDSLITQDIPEITPIEKYQLEITNLFHDAGEPFCAEKDVLYGKPRDKDAETKGRHQALARAFGGKVSVMIIELSEPVLNGTLKKQAFRFQTLERIGYYTTGARAAELYLRQSDGTDSDLSTAERMVAGKIANDVYGHQQPQLEEVRGLSTVNHLLLSKGGVMRVASASYSEIANK